MANKRISDLPAETDPASTDVVAIDGATTRKATRASLLKENLEAIRGLTSAADKGIQFTGAGTAATYDLTAAGKALLDDADAAEQRTTLGLVIGTNVQAYDAELSAIAGLSSAADRLPYFTGSGTASLATFTTFGRSLVDDADASAARTTLGLGALAVESTISTSLLDANAVSNAKMATMAAYTLKGNATGSSAVPTDIDVTALTSKPSPVSGDIVLIQDSAASNAFKKTTVGALASAGSVASFNGRTGAVSPAQGDYSTNLIPGTTTNDNASSGNVGEFVSSTVASGSAITLVNVTYTNLTSISLTAGDWDVSASVAIQGGGSVSTISQNVVSISTTSATVSSNPGEFVFHFIGGSSGVDIGSSFESSVVGPARLSLSATTTVYLVVRATFTGNAPKAYGIIRARRVR